MPIHKVEIIPEPEKRTRTIIKTKDIPAFVGNGDISVLCGGCAAILISNIFPGQIKRVVIKCPECGNFNDTTEACW